MMTEQEKELLIKDLLRKEEEVVTRCLAILENTDIPKRRTKRARLTKTRACLAFLESWMVKKNAALTSHTG